MSGTERGGCSRKGGISMAKVRKCGEVIMAKHVFVTAVWISLGKGITARSGSFVKSGLRVISRSHSVPQFTAQ